MRLKPSYPRLRQDHPLASGLVGAWLMTEGSGGRLRNAVGDANLDAATVNTPEWSIGNTGYAFGGNGTGHAQIPHSQQFDLQELTLSAFLMRTGGITDFDMVIGMAVATSPTNVPYHAYFTSSKLTFRFYSTITRSVTEPSGGITSNLNEWFFYQFTIRKSTSTNSRLSMYRDGVLIDTASVIGAPPSRVVPFCIGAENDRRYFNGKIGAAWLHSRDLELSGQIGEMAADPFAMFRPRQRSYFAFEEVAGTTVTPTTATLSLTPFAPTVSATANQTFVPGTATLSLTPFAPEVTADNAVEVTPTTASLSLTPFAPTVQATDNKTAEPTAATLATTGFAPTIAVTANVEVEPTTATLTLTPFSPGITAGANVVVTPVTATLSLNEFSPTVTASEAGSVTPATATLTLTPFAPTVTATANQTFEPTTATLTLTEFAPTIEVGAAVVVTPSTATLSLTEFAPTIAVTNNIVIMPATLTLALETFAPTIAGSVLVTPATATLTITSHRPNLGGQSPSAVYYYYLMS